MNEQAEKKYWQAIGAQDLADAVDGNPAKACRLDKIAREMMAAWRVQYPDAAAEIDAERATEKTERQARNADAINRATRLED